MKMPINIRMKSDFFPKLQLKQKSYFPWNSINTIVRQVYKLVNKLII